MSLLEVTMLVCFGISWPISIAKIWRTKTVAGKSPAFLGIIMLGYAAGIAHKLSFSRDWVLMLYVLNFSMVSVDLILYRHFSKAPKQLKTSLDDTEHVIPVGANPSLQEVPSYRPSSAPLASGNWPIQPGATAARSRNLTRHTKKRQTGT